MAAECKNLPHPDEINWSRHLSWLKKLMSPRFHELCARRVQSLVITQGYFVQWFKTFESPVYQVSASKTDCSLPLLSALPSKAFLAPHPSFNSNFLFLSDSSPPAYILIFSLVTSPLCQLTSPQTFFSLPPALLALTYTFSICILLSPIHSP